MILMTKARKCRKMKQKHNNLEHVKTARFYSKYFQGAIRFQSSKSKQTPKQSEKKNKNWRKRLLFKKYMYLRPTSTDGTCNHTKIDILQRDGILPNQENMNVS